MCVCVACVAFPLCDSPPRCAAASAALPSVAALRHSVVGCCSGGSAQCACGRSERTQRCQTHKASARGIGGDGDRKHSGETRRCSAWRLSLSRFSLVLWLCSQPYVKLKLNGGSKARSAVCSNTLDPGTATTRNGGCWRASLTLLRLAVFGCSLGSPVVLLPLIQCGISIAPSAGAARVRRRCEKWRPREC